MPIAQVDKPFLRAFRVEFAAAVKELETKHGINIMLGNIRFDAGSFRTKLDVSLKGPNTGGLRPPGAPKAENTAQLRRILETAHGPGALNATYTIGSTHGITFTGYKPSRFKYPISFVTARGRAMKCSLESCTRARRET